MLYEIQANPLPTFIHNITHCPIISGLEVYEGHCYFPIIESYPISTIVIA